MRKFLPVALLLFLLFSACHAPVNTAETTAAAAPRTTPAATLPPETTLPAEIVAFQSAAIEKAAREALSMPEGPLTREMLDSVTTLYVVLDTWRLARHLWPETLPFPAEGGADVSELAYFPHLETLIVEGLDSDADSLPILPSLTDLKILWHSSSVSDHVLNLAPLAAFSKLKSLEISGYGFTNMEALAALPLENLAVYRAYVPDLAVFSALTGLKSLKLYNYRMALWEFPWNSQLSDLSPLVPLQNLETLAICAGMSDLSVLTALPKLSALSLGAVVREDYSFLNQMPNLAHLAINTGEIHMTDADLPQGLLSLVIFDEPTSPIHFENLPPGLECYCFLNKQTENYKTYYLPYDYDWGPHQQMYR